eukprot:TRINITY_DN27792_c0_g1_i1.p1 TRINITY_DN27792_c0_g1~~TRINITY_DN27792_c0_g1_i1.p1  ORF type:complete len:345 (-),score=78.13 TRINITY_DN27792_c0_g1_i1:24-953(-)
MGVVLGENQWECMCRKHFGLSSPATIKPPTNNPPKEVTVTWKETYKRHYWLPKKMSKIYKLQSRPPEYTLPTTLVPSSKRISLSTHLVGNASLGYDCQCGHARHRLSLIGARFAFGDSYEEESPPSRLYYDKETGYTKHASFQLSEANPSLQEGPLTQNSYIFYYSPLLPQSFTYMANYMYYYQRKLEKDRFEKRDVVEGICDPKYVRSEQVRSPCFWMTPMVMVEFHCEEKFLSPFHREYNNSSIVIQAKRLAEKVQCPYLIVENDKDQIVSIFEELEKEYRKISQVTNLEPIEIDRNAPLDPSLHLK